ncbi:MAG TPA: hypothetical protein VFG77_05275 [Nitrososphaeraceae archaeon]|nr:hypothetical protein [Nitrososphaeraceae archaeon]
MALTAVVYMFVRRIGGLLSKAQTVFRYLTALGAIKVDIEKFQPRLQEIERYLNNDDWVLSEYWINRIQKEYAEVFLSKLSSISSSPSYL